MRRAATVLALLLTLFGIAATHAGAVEPWEWHSEQPVAEGVGVPASLGEIGDVECWSANRCLLITAGNQGRPAGLYAYDGAGWYLYSTVCGGHEGRIAWAGPDEFWTISDQRPGEETSPKGGLEGLSLCHFVNGEVKESFAEPTGQADSFLKMDAAACDGPGNCWFAGKRLPGEPNVGAFHLHWDGSSLTAIPSLTDPEPWLSDPGRSVLGLAFFGGQLFESVAVQAEDQAEGETEPSFLHRINLAAVAPFERLETPGLVTGGTPEGLEGFRFASNGASLWALSGANEGGATTPTLLTFQGFSFAQLPLGGSVFGPGTAIRGFAMEPNSEGAWASFVPRNDRSGSARVARIQANGTVDGEVALPRPEEELSSKGLAGPMSCSAVAQCWMATSKGWLFHLGGPPAEGPNTDPAMHQLITFRPCDNACPSLAGVGLPEDNSGAEPERELFAEVPEYPIPVEHLRRPQPPYKHLKQKVIKGTILQLTFDLTTRAHVQLIAKERKAVVAKTALMTMDKGHHRIRLTLDPKHWPTHLSFQVHPIKKKKKAPK
jgi:hypothetical protein